MKILRHLFTVLIAATTALSVSATYRVHSVKGIVTITSAGKSSTATKGDKVLPSDMVNIPEGAVLEVINDINNTIYTSTASGKMTLTRLMLDSKSKAADNAAAVNSRLKFAGRSAADKSNHVYAERGMVKRSLASFDPEASTMMVNPEALARRVASALGSSHASCDTTLNFSAAIPGENAAFSLRNTLSSPVYFNIIRLTEDGKAEISPLGQPSGSYILLPGQSMSRADNSPIPSTEKQLLVATHYNFDIDELLEALSAALKSESPAEAAPQPELNLPVFVRNL